MTQQNDLYHYTTRENLDSIYREGAIRAGSSGKVYLLPMLYSSAEVVMEELGIAGKVVECGIHIPITSTQELLPPWSVVPPLVDAGTGQVLRRGGGLEIAIAGDLPLPDSVAAFDLK